MPGSRQNIVSAASSGAASVRRHDALSGAQSLVILLSVNAGLRAGENAGLRVDMVVDATGENRSCDRGARLCRKKGSGRVISHAFRSTQRLAEWGKMAGNQRVQSFRSERGGRWRPLASSTGLPLPTGQPARRLLVAFGTSHLYHACCAPRSSGWRLSARRAAARGHRAKMQTHAAVH